jgi:hypothetical protein
MDLNELKKEYENQDNRATAFPLCVWVQELKFICSSSINEEINGYFDAIRIGCDPDGIKFKAYYKYIPVELFLTIEGAKDYIKADKHNLREPRTWVGHFNKKNFEMRELLKEIGFKVRD